MANRLRTVQWIFIAAGVVLVGVFVAAIVHREMGSRADLEAFEEARRARAAATPAPTPTPEPTPVPLSADLPVDTTLWAKGRIEKYEESLDHEFDSYHYVYYEFYRIDYHYGKCYSYGKFYFLYNNYYYLDLVNNFYNISSF